MARVRVPAVTKVGPLVSWLVVLTPLPCSIRSPLYCHVLAVAFQLCWNFVPTVRCVRPKGYAHRWPRALMPSAWVQPGFKGHLISMENSSNYCNYPSEEGANYVVRTCRRSANCTRTPLKTSDKIRIYKNNALNHQV